MYSVLYFVASKLRFNENLYRVKIYEKTFLKKIEFSLNYFRNTPNIPPSMHYSSPFLLITSIAQCRTFCYSCTQSVPVSVEWFESQFIPEPFRQQNKKHNNIPRAFIANSDDVVIVIKRSVGIYLSAYNSKSLTCIMFEYNVYKQMVFLE